jgi:hypothetical protein
MIAVMTLLALAAQTSVPDEVPMRATPHAVLARVAACGVKRSDARVRDDATIQEDVVAVRNGVVLTDIQLDCLATVETETYWYLQFDAATQARYRPRAFRTSEAASLAMAKAWVAAHGLASRLPAWREGQDDPAIAVVAIEKLCDAPPGSFSNIGGMMTMNPPMTLDPLPASWGAQLQCAMNVSTVVGLKFGFIGNEAEEPAPPR